jgi:hypothetical protein
VLCSGWAHLIPFDTLKIIATDDDEAVEKAIEWQANVPIASEGETWLQVVRDGVLIYSKPNAESGGRIGNA